LTTSQTLLLAVGILGIFLVLLRENEVKKLLLTFVVIYAAFFNLASARKKVCHLVSSGQLAGSINDAQKAE